MFESVILILILTGLYHISPVYFLFIFINFSLFFYNCILSSDISLSVSTIVVFLNKLNNSLLNPVIFIFIFILFATKYYYKEGSPNYRYLFVMFLVGVPCSIELSQPSYFLYNLFSSSFAPTLTNGLLIVHPLLLYSFYVALVFFSIWAPLRLKTKQSSKFLFYPYGLSYTQAYLGGIGALFLGAWWSHQELNWGGFWSWDLVEIFLLVSVVYTVLRQHYTSLTQVSYLKIIFFSLNFVMYIFSVRYNLINSIHNFISQSAFLYKITYFILSYCLLFVSLSCCCYIRYSQLNFSKVYKRLYIFLESFYLVLVFYVFITYLGFYIGNVSSLLVINLIPIVLNTLSISLLTSYVSVFGLYMPFTESILLAVILCLPWRFKPLWVTHLTIIIIMYKLLLWYGTILLAPLTEHLLIIASVSYNNITIIESTQQVWARTHACFNLPWLSLYIDNSSNSFVKSFYDLVIYSTPVTAPNLSLTLFMHKYFGKISFSENILILIIITISACFYFKSVDRQIKIYF